MSGNSLRGAVCRTGEDKNMRACLTQAQGQASGAAGVVSYAGESSRKKPPEGGFRHMGSNLIS